MPQIKVNSPVIVYNDSRISLKHQYTWDGFAPDK